MNESNIRKTLQALGVDKVSRTKNNILFPCILAPWTHEKGQDRRPSMEIRIEPEGESCYFCFTCKAKGTLVGLLMDLNAYTGGKYQDLESQVIRHEEDLGMSTLLESALSEFQPKEVEKPNVFDPSLVEKYIGKVPHYILERGISLETCKRWSLGHDTDQDRLVFPIYDWSTSLVGLVGRAVRPETTPRYYNYWNFTKSKYLYGEHLLSTDYPHIVVVEGMVSALKASQAELGNVVGLMGSRLSEEQRKKLFMLNRTIYVMADPDSAGDACRKQFAEDLGPKANVMNVTLPPEKDPADCTEDQLRAAFAEAVFI